MKMEFYITIIKVKFLLEMGWGHFYCNGNQWGLGARCARAHNCLDLWIIKMFEMNKCSLGCASLYPHPPFPVFDFCYKRSIWQLFLAKLSNSMKFKIDLLKLYLMGSRVDHKCISLNNEMPSEVGVILGNTKKWMNG